MNLNKIKIIASVALLLSTTAVAHESAVWSYVGETGPKQWGQIDKEFLACSEGITQSPININKKDLVSNKDPIMFDYEAHPLSNNIENFTDKGLTKGMKVDNKEYHLSQFHFHTPSEHSIDGKIYPAEVHFVHHDEDGNLAVVGVLFKEGKYNSKFENVIESANQGITKKHAVEASNIMKLLPEDKEYLHYMGSLTTPPCTAGVNWFVMKHQVEASKEQLTALAKAMPANARPIQESFGRVAK